ncbi:Ribonuclease P protein subunit p30 [Porites harrisoni]
MKKINPRLKVYTRLTVQLDDQSQVHQLSSDPVQSHDILAVQPATEKLFHQACKTLDVDIISLDMTELLPFYLKFPTEEQSKAAITKNCRDVLFHADARKGTERSVISGKLLKEPAELLSDKEEGDISEDCTGHSKEKNVDDNDEGDNYEPKEKKSKVE